MLGANDSVNVSVGRRILRAENAFKLLDFSKFMSYSSFSKEVLVKNVRVTEF